MSSARKKEFFGFVCVQFDSAFPLKKIKQLLGQLQKSLLKQITLVKTKEKYLKLILYL